MLGPQPRNTYLGAGEVARRLDCLAAACPVREHEAVIALCHRQGIWLARTNGGELRARTVVIATGGENVPRTPKLASRLSERIAQRHAADYRAPADLPGQGVLVVGSAQSGYQIAEELLAVTERSVPLIDRWRYRGCASSSHTIGHFRQTRTGQPRCGPRTAAAATGPAPPGPAQPRASIGVPRATASPASAQNRESRAVRTAAFACGTQVLPSASH